MRIFALSDPHLSTVVDKPMEVFGSRWKDYMQRIRQGWLDTVDDQDAVILSGDISWGLKMEEVLPDLEWLHQLPGKKFITKGNHDLWWTSVSKMNSYHEDIRFIHNNHEIFGNTAICGSRGWTLPFMAAEWTDHDEKIYRREIQRLETAIASAAARGCRDIIVSLHYPPTDKSGRATEFTNVIERYPVTDVVYGHLHGDDARKAAFTGKRADVRYRMVSSDCINFTPVLIREHV